MNECSRLLDAEMWLDGEAGEQADAIARHVAVCSTCKAHIETLRRLDFAAREAGTRVKATLDLTERLNDLDAARPAAQPVQPVSRRWMLYGGAAAASIVAVTSFVWRSGNAESAARHGLVRAQGAVSCTATCLAVRLTLDRWPSLLAVGSPDCGF